MSNMKSVNEYELLDVAGKMVVFTYDSHWTREMVESFIAAMQGTADKLKEAGAINVILLSSDITLNTLDEQQLIEMGVLGDGGLPRMD